VHDESNCDGSSEAGYHGLPVVPCICNWIVRLSVWSEIRPELLQELSSSNVAGPHMLMYSLTLQPFNAMTMSNSRGASNAKKFRPQSSRRPAQRMIPVYAPVRVSKFEGDVLMWITVLTALRARMLWKALLEKEQGPNVQLAFTSAPEFKAPIPDRHILDISSTVWKQPALMLWKHGCLASQGDAINKTVIITIKWDDFIVKHLKSVSRHGQACTATCWIGVEFFSTAHRPYWNFETPR